MNKKHIHHIWRKLRPVHSWIFLGLALACIGIGIFGMRQNNLTAIQLRDNVLEADKNGTDVEEPLRTLRQYVYSHMNSNLSTGTGVQHPVQLKYRYDRLVAAEKARVEAVNGDIYTRAQSDCERRFPAGVSGSGRIKCIEQYVSQNGVTENAIPDALYKFDFVSPRWSPDIAGFGLLFAVIFFALFVVRFTLERWFRHTLREHA